MHGDNNKCDLNQNEPHQSFMSEHKALEDHVHRVEIEKNEKSCFESNESISLGIDEE